MPFWQCTFSLASSRWLCHINFLAIASFCLTLVSILHYQFFGPFFSWWSAPHTGGRVKTKKCFKSFLQKQREFLMALNAHTHTHMFASGEKRDFVLSLCLVTKLIMPSKSRLYRSPCRCDKRCGPASLHFPPLARATESLFKFLLSWWWPSIVGDYVVLSEGQHIIYSKEGKRRSQKAARAVTHFIQTLCSRHH